MWLIYFKYVKSLTRSRRVDVKFILLVIIGIALLSIGLPLSFSQHSICHTGSSYMACDIYRGLYKIGDVRIYDNGSFYVSINGKSVRGVFNCPDCDAVNLTRIYVRGVVLRAEGRVEYFYHASYLSAYLLLIPLAVFALSALQISSGKLLDFYRGVKSLKLAGAATLTLSVFIYFLDPLYSALVALYSIAILAVSQYTLRRIRKWAILILT